jgi:uncharacterized membrane protein YfcA
VTQNLAQELLPAASGTLVGCSLGLIGGGRSVLGVPLMVYLVRVPNPMSRSARARSASRPMRRGAARRAAG